MARRVALRLALTLALASAAAANGIRIVDRPDVGPFTSLQSAVNAAFDGELLLLTGDASFGSAIIDGKSLSIVGLPGGSFEYTGGITVRNLAAGQVVFLAGLDVFNSAGVGLTLSNNQGHVRVQDCEIYGGKGGSSGNYTTYAGVSVVGCPRVVLADCEMGGGYWTYLSGAPPVQGGTGLDSTNSSIALFDCIVTGGTGSHETYPGGKGGSGLKINGWGAFLSGTTVRGGAGGEPDYIGCASGGPGGDALTVIGAQVQMLDSPLVPGPGGHGLCGPDGPPGNAFTNSGGVLTTLPGEARMLQGVSVASDASPLTVTLSGAPGDKVWLFRSYEPSHLFLPGLGTWTVHRPAFVPLVPLGVVPPSGTLTANVGMPALDAGDVQGLAFCQAFVLNASGKGFVSSPLQVAVIDAAGAPDCNSTQLNDFLELIQQSVPDCNKNLLVDSCEIASGPFDCNGNGIPDTCDIASGLEKDCNGNQIPDSCDLVSGFAADCNGNNRPDSCDIAVGYSLDVNHNGIPDECEPIAPSTWWVDDDAAPGGNGSQAQPFQTIGAGIAAAFHGDTVLIRNGLYRGAGNKNLETNGAEIVIRSESGAAGCVIDCEGSGQGFYVHDGEGQGLRFQGLTIRNGNAKSGGLYAEGGGFAILSSSPQIVGCVIENCQAWRHGGGVFAYDTSIQIRNTLIRNCSAFSSPSYGPGKGGAMYLWARGGGPPPVVASSGIQDCSSHEGGGLYVGGSPVLISHCRIVGNTGTLGGGVHLNPYAGAWASMDDCLLAGNSAERGGAVQLSSATASLVVTDCTFVQNSATLEGGTLRVSTPGLSAPITIYDSIIWSSSAPLGATLYQSGVGSVTVARCDVQGGSSGFALAAGSSLTYGPGNLDLDPLFVDIDGPDNNLLTLADNDYRLAAGSPCVDAGDNALVALDVVDIDGDGNFSEPTPLDLFLRPRFVEDPLAPNVGQGTPPLVDLGALERQP
jgi:hypothetical protein